MRRLFRLAALSLLACALYLASAAPAHAQARTHEVQAGENLFRIGLRYGVSVDDLMRANGLSNYNIYVGQVLIIPDAPGAGGSSPAPASTPAPQPTVIVVPGEPVYHIVQPGETLFRIGVRYNLPWTKIQVANNLVGDRLYAGQRLLIPVNGEAPTPAPAAPTQAAPTPAPTEAAPTPTPAPTEAAPTEAAPTDAAPAAETVHVVQAGETLFTIGLKYNVRWPAIMAANNLASDQIFAGQRLTIPAPGSAAAEVTLPPAGQGPVAGLAGRYFLVDISEQRLYAFEGDQLVRSTLVSTGRWPTPTVTGTYYIYARYVSTRMRGPDYDLPNVPYTQYFYKGYGLHGTYWHSNFGTPMSHGCVNMPTPEAEWAYNWAGIGTPVIVQQ